LHLGCAASALTWLLKRSLCLLQLLDEFVEAVMSRWPKTVLQFEDFQLQYAHTLLQRYKNQHLVFNDDIQVGFHCCCASATACETEA